MLQKYIFFSKPVHIFEIIVNLQTKPESVCFVENFTQHEALLTIKLNLTLSHLHSYRCHAPVSVYSRGRVGPPRSSFLLQAGVGWGSYNDPSLHYCLKGEEYFGKVEKTEKVATQKSFQTKNILVLTPSC